MNYQSQRIKFSSYSNGTDGSNGVTPHVGDDGYWYIGNTNTGVKAQGIDGISFVGVTEYYYATLATEIKEGKPVVPKFNKDNWKTAISDTGFGTKNSAGVTYKYLWNVEVIESNNNGTIESKPTSEDLVDIYIGGRVPSEYISYYAASTSSTAPDKQPVLDEDGNTITEQENSVWSKQFDGSADANNFLYEITFVKYAETDEEGKNLYAKMAGPTLIGRNSAGVILSLTNDYDTVARNSLGAIISNLPITVTAKIHEGNTEKTGIEIGLTPPDAFKLDESLNSEYASYDEDTNTLSIEGVPSDFVSGTFKFSYSGFEKDFSLKVIPSEVDYDLVIDKTSANSSVAGSITVTVKRTDVINGSVTLTKNGDDENIKLYKDGNEVQGDGEWVFDYEKGNLIPFTFQIKDTRTHPVIWDEETVEFHRETGLKRLYTATTSGTKAAWMGWSQKSEDSWSVIPDDTRNSKIFEGDQIYILGTVTDVYTSIEKNTYQIAKITGTVIDFVKNSSGKVTTVKINNIGIEWGASIGESAYALSLDNDADTIVQNSAGAWISGQASVTVTGYIGSEQKTGLSEGNIGVIELISVPTDWLENTHYTFENNILTYNPSEAIPEGFTSGEFKFQWKSSSEDGAVIYGEKVFSLKKTTSLADYDLVIPQTVYNSSTEGGTIAVSVLKKDATGTTTLTSKNNDESIKLYQKKENNYKAIDWSVTYNEKDKDPIHFVLTSSDGVLGTLDKDGYATFTTNPTIIWDEEVVEFVLDGENGEDSVAYWLQCNTPIISKAANGDYQTETVTFTPMIQVGSETPRVATGTDPIKIAIWADTSPAPTTGTLVGEQTITLVKEGANTQANKYTVNQALHCKMFFVQDGTHVKIDEQAADVLADGVTITTVEYAVNDSGTQEPTSGWNTSYPDSIPQGSFLWTKITYSNGNKAISSLYQPLDGQHATAAYVIDLTNDSIIIGTDKDGNRTDWSLLDTISEVRVIVWEGGENITDQCSFSWEVSDGNSDLLSNTNSSTIYFKSKTDKTKDPIGADSVTAEVTVIKNAIGDEAAKELGSKTCSVTKNKQGEPGSNAITYSLAVSPNSWNSDESSSISPTFVVTKYTGSTPSTMSTGYTIKVGDNSYSGNGITETTTFDLWIDQVKVDSETVTAVQNGNDSTVPGPPGDDGSDGKTRGTIVLYSTTTTMDPIPSKPTSSTIGSTWQTSAPPPDSTNKFVWETKGAYTEDLDGSNREYDDNWTTPELHSAYIANNVSGSTAAEYYKLFGTDETNQGMKFIDGKLYINASMINTGALTVKNGDSDETLFSAGWDDSRVGSVKIAGWNAKGDALESETVNDDGAPNIFISPEGRETDVSDFGAKDDNMTTIEEDQIVFKAGNNFMVSANGTLYAKAGVLGTSQLGDIITSLEQSVLAAELSADWASQFAQQADQSAGDASLAAEAANGAKDEVNGSLTEARIAADNASNYATNASNSAQEANSSASNATEQAGNAVQAAVDAEAAAVRAEAAMDGKLDAMAPTGDYGWKVSPDTGASLYTQWNTENPVEVFRMGNLNGIGGREEDEPGLYIYGNGQFTGTIYAKDGEIGTMKIGDIASKDDVTIGQNLAVRNSLTAYNGTLTDSEYHYTISGTNPGGYATGLCIGQEIFNAGNNYVISFNISFVKNSAADYEVAGHHEGFTINKIKIDDSEVTDSYDYGAGVSLGAKNQAHSVSLYVTFDGDASDNNLYIQPNRSPAAAGQNLEFIIWNLKVEKGTTQTPWVAPMDAVSNNSTGSYSWQFSPSNGIKMWNGAQINDNEVFRVDARGAYINGKVIARSGQIGNMTIEEVEQGIENAMSADENSNNFSWKFSPTEGMFMWNGQQPTNPTNAQTKDAILAIYNAGTLTDPNYKLSMKGHVEADSGRIGDFELEYGGLASSSIIIQPGQIQFPTQASMLLGESVEFISNDEEVQINTDGNKNFILQNAGGAGIKFLNNKQTDTSDSELHITNSNVTATVYQSSSDNPTGVVMKFTLSGEFEWRKGIGFYESTIKTIRCQFTVPRYNTKVQATFSVTFPGEMTAYGNIKSEAVVQTTLLTWDTNATYDGIIFGTGHNTSIAKTGILYSSGDTRENNILFCLGSFHPITNNQGFLGRNDNKWNSITAYNLDLSSDRKVKKNIEDLDEKYEDIFNQLRPKTYQFKNGESGRLHIGFIAQDIEDILIQEQINSQDFAAYCKYFNKDGTPGYNLRYTEFIPLNTWQIQKLKPRVSALEQTILDYETRISSLETEIQNLKSS